MDLTDFIVTIIGNNIQDELVGVWAYSLLLLWRLEDERRRLESVSYYGNNNKHPKGFKKIMRSTHPLICTSEIHRGKYGLNQFLDLTDFIITIIGNDIQWELEGVGTCSILPLWGLKDERRRLESVSYYGNDKNDP